MAREIKFRVFDGSDTMSKPFTLQDIQEGKIQFAPDCPIMQFTGMLDKNGKEIYDGDILSFKSGLSTPFEVMHEGKKLTAYEPIFNIAIVIFYKSAFGLHNAIDTTREHEAQKYTGTSHYGTLQSATWDKEVIGNIYENPELFK